MSRTHMNMRGSSLADWTCAPYLNNVYLELNAYSLESLCWMERAQGLNQDPTATLLDVYWTGRARA